MDEWDMNYWKEDGDFSRKMKWNGINERKSWMDASIDIYRQKVYIFRFTIYKLNRSFN